MPPEACDSPETVLGAHYARRSRGDNPQMKTLRIVAAVLSGAMTLAAIPAFAQTTDASAAGDMDPSIAAARCPYVRDDASCVPSVQSQTGGSPQPDSDGTLTAQIPRHVSRPPMRPRPVAYPRRYPGPWMGSGRHAAIGAAIGFGIGAAIGAKAGWHEPAGTTIKASIVVGGIGALIGAAIGSGPPLMAQSRHHRRRRLDHQRPGESAEENDEVALSHSPSPRVRSDKPNSR